MVECPLAGGIARNQVGAFQAAHGRLHLAGAECVNPHFAGKLFAGFLSVGAEFAVGKVFKDLPVERFQFAPGVAVIGVVI